MVDEQLLILSFEFLKTRSEYWDYRHITLSALRQTLMKATSECLSSSSNSSSKDGSEYKDNDLLSMEKRNNLWCEKNLLKSNICLCNDRNINNSTDSGKNIAYKELDKCVNDELMKQQNHICSCAQNDNKRDLNAWNHLIEYKEYITDNHDDLRQDVLIDGIKANRKERNLYLIEAGMNSNSDDIGRSNFNVFLEIRLTECLVFSQYTPKTVLTSDEFDALSSVGFNSAETLFRSPPTRSIGSVSVPVGIGSHPAPQSSLSTDIVVDIADRTMDHVDNAIFDAAHSHIKIDSGDLMNDNDLDGNNNDELISETQHQNSKMCLTSDLSDESGYEFIDSGIDCTISANGMTSDVNDNTIENECCKHRHEKTEKQRNKKKRGKIRHRRYSSSKNNNIKLN